MSLQARLLLAIGSVLLFAFIILEAFHFQDSKQNAAQDLQDQAEKVRSLLMAYRTTQQKVFLEDKVKLDPVTLKFLPAYAIGQISHEYPKWDSSGFSFNNVSDQPRNPEHQADKLELEAIAYFRKNPEKKYYLNLLKMKWANRIIFMRVLSGLKNAVLSVMVNAKMLRKPFASCMTRLGATKWVIYVV